MSETKPNGENKMVVLIAAEPNKGKTASLRNLPMEEVAYLNSDLTNLPFPEQGIHNIKIKDAQQVPNYVKQCEENPKIKYTVLDTLTTMMNMYELTYITPLAGTKNYVSAWTGYGKLLGDVVHAMKAGSNHTVVLTHLQTTYDEGSQEYVSKIPIKGSLGKLGIEREFSIILQARLVSLKELDGFDNPWLNITEDEEFYGRKYVFQTKPFKDTGLMCRTPMGCFDRNSVFIDNDVHMLMGVLDDYYK